MCANPWVESQAGDTRIWQLSHRIRKLSTYGLAGWQTRRCSPYRESKLRYNRQGNSENLLGVKAIFSTWTQKLHPLPFYSYISIDERGYTWPRRSPSGSQDISTFLTWNQLRERWMMTAESQRAVVNRMAKLAATHWLFDTALTVDR